jgi:ABC-2 type transport system ATP-binding protein
MSVIDCSHVSIRYITGDFKSIGLKEYIVRRLTNNYHVKEFWADKDITFQLEKGDMLGIIGTNGAGKSTLLKAITGIMVPTGGEIKVKGNIAALLELASGFDGDMTVRENTYLRGALLGYTRRFLDEKYDEIIRFAELQDFQDYMFKQLSSGMKSRLAFSIACLVNPDILILDEVLSVGDGAFRKKSGDKMKEIISGGVTAILVSHVMPQVRELCNKILWLDHGKQVIFTDDAELACDAYEEFLAQKKKKPPKTVEEMRKLQRAWHIRQEKETAEKAKKAAEKAAKEAKAAHEKAEADRKALQNN